MQLRYTTDQIQQVAQALVTHLNKSAGIIQGVKTFHWQGASYFEGWKKRCRLQKDLITSNFGYEALQAVHVWGFGSPCGSLQSDQKLCYLLKSCLRSFHEPDVVSDPTRQQQDDDRFHALHTVLDRAKSSGAGIGIATLSKWLCFVDQERYAIYDSRVSRALYPVQVGAGELAGSRLFPVVASRSTSALVDSVSSWKVDRLARMYMDYISVLREASKLCSVDSVNGSLIPAEIEMALFMRGKPALQPTPDARVLLREMWADPTQAVQVPCKLIATLPPVGKERGLRRKHDENFKKQVAEAARQNGVSISKVAQDYRVNPTSVRDWMSKF